MQSSDFIQYYCSSCDRLLRSKSSLPATFAKCPKCGKVMAVPSSPSQDAAPKPAENPQESDTDPDTIAMGRLPPMSPPLIGIREAPPTLDPEVMLRYVPARADGEDDLCSHGNV